MTTKLTLSLEKSIIDKAKYYAKNTNRSLSEIIESYLSKITDESPTVEVSERLSKLVGVIKLPIDFDEKHELRSALEKKHL